MDEIDVYGLNYKDDEKEAKKFFPKLNLVTIKNSSHWIHYENQEKFLIETLNYLRT